MLRKQPVNGANRSADICMRHGRVTDTTQGRNKHGNGGWL